MSSQLVIKAISKEGTATKFWESDPSLLGNVASERVSEWTAISVKGRRRTGKRGGAPGRLEGRETWGLTSTAGRGEGKVP